MKVWQLRAGSLLALGLVSCANMPQVPSGVCGNAVIEPGEDCDTFAPDAASRCRPEGSVGECRLDCAPREDGPRGICPTDWGCPSDGICRPPTGGFDPIFSSGVGRGARLMSGDFDGDNRADLLTLEPEDSIGKTRMEFLYFDQRGTVVDSRAFPKLLGAPTVADLSGDGRSDVAFSFDRLSLLRGRADRSLLPDTFGSYRIPSHRVRMFGVSSTEVSRSSAVVALTTLDGVSGFHSPSVDRLRPIGTLPVELEGLAGDPVVGNVIESIEDSPCDEFVFAIAGASEFSLVDLCALDEKGELVWREEVREQVIALPDAMTVDLPPMLADLDADGHLDVLLSSGPRVLVSRGDGSALGPPEVVDFTAFHGVDEIPSERRLPLAVGELSGDGSPDFVFNDRVYTSSSRNGKTTYDVVFVNLGAPWTQALIGDFNRDDHPDLAAASSGRLNIDFLNGQSSRFLAASSLATKGAVTHLGMGDINGDLVQDLVFAEKPVSADRPAIISVAFGSTAGPPALPTPIASVRNIEQIAVFEESGIGNLVVASTEAGDADKTGVLTLLQGSPDRLPLASYRLTSFSQTGSILDYVALSVAAGPFLGPSSHDLVVFSLAVEEAALEDGKTEEDKSDWAFWLVPEIDRGNRTPYRLPFDWAKARLSPSTANADDVSLDVSAASADIDRDALNDAVFVMPSVEPTPCAVISFRAVKPGSAQTDLLRLTEPCPRAAPAFGDFDADGATDLAIMVGRVDSAERRIRVLWNDGAGRFTEARTTYVTGAGERPEQFAVMPSPWSRPNQLVYVTADRVWSVVKQSGSKLFGAPRPLGDALRGTGIATGDFNGDGVFDVAITGSGDITLFKAALEEQ